jgi:peptide/nickel transport system permease protein
MAQGTRAKETQAQGAAQEAKTAAPIELQIEDQEDVGELSQGQLMVRRFMQSKLSVFGLVVIILLYIIVIFADFVSPYYYDQQFPDGIWAPPTKIRFQDGRLGVYGVSTVLDEKTFKFEFVEDDSVFYPIKFFYKSWSYKLLWLIPTDVHLFGVDSPGILYLWGADKLGRDMFSRIVRGGQISMTIGFFGTAISLILGSIIGTASGYLGGATDNLIQRSMELISSFPQIPLWAALAGALPQNMPVIQRFFLITIILSFLGWIGLARQVRGKVMAYRSNDYTSAARSAGAGHMYIILNHMLPNAASHIAVVAAMSIPAMIGAEVALSFLGLGIQPPLVSWGSLLRQAQNVTAVIQHPWEMLPAVAVIIAVACFNFLSDGMRDAVDPYG